MSELIDKLHTYRCMEKHFYPEDIVTTRDIWELLDEIERLNSIIKEVREYIEYQLENLDFEEDTKAKMLGAMVLVLLDKEKE